MGPGLFASRPLDTFGGPSPMAPAARKQDNGAMETKQMRKSNRLLAAMAIGLVALIAVAAVFVAVRDPATFDPDTPEGVTQAYVVAVLDDDAEAAHALLTPELQLRCDVDDLEYSYYGREDRRITLVESDINGDEAKIDVKFRVTYDEGLFGYTESSHEETFKLARSDGAWRIAQAPWPYYRCPEVSP